jgi:type I restriction enzyme S subunit
MKDSGVAWLGDIPAEWSASKVFSHYKRKRVKNYPNEELLSVYRDYGVIPKSSRDDNHNTESVDLSNYQLVEKDDLVTNKMKTWQGSIAVSKYRGIVSPAYYVMSPMSDGQVAPRFIHYLLRSPIYISQYRRLSKGIRPGQWDLEYDQFKGLELPLPDYETQERIANYLDEETALIDDLIAKQQRLLALLEEKRRATITHAVTRGLNPSVDLKETNIPWLGQIPVHWKLKKARYLFDRIKDVPRNGDDVVTAFRDGEVVLRSLRRTEGFTFADKEIGYQHVSKGDLVIHAMDGFAGAIGVSKSHGKMSPVCSICRPKDESKINTEYFAQLVRTMAKSDWLTAIAKGIRERSTDFRWADFANMEFPLPPPEEQSAIINSIQDEELKLATLKNKINVQISFLKERRTSLISHAVTGKIKV